MASRFLIINADDFGYNDPITQGIQKGYREGLITSTSAIVNVPGAPEPHAGDPGLPIGLHLNLTAGRPVLPAEKVPHLLGTNGAFLPFEAFLPHLFDAPLDEIRAEIAAQAQLLIDCGVTFDHIDYHQHILALNASLFDLVVDLAETYHVPVRQPVSNFIQRRFKIDDLWAFGTSLKAMGSVFLRKPRYIHCLLRQIIAFRHLRVEAARLGPQTGLLTPFSITRP